MLNIRANSLVVSEDCGEKNPLDFCSNGIQQILRHMRRTGGSLTIIRATLLKVILRGKKVTVWVAASVLGFIGLCVFALFAWQVPVACAPALVYAIIGLMQRAYLREVPPDQRQMEPDKQQAASLTLAGFCFTSLSLLVSFFKDAIQRDNKWPENIVLFFCCALVSFVASYMTLRYRTKNLFAFMSDAFIDNGFWCIIVGLLAFFIRSGYMTKAAIAMSVLLVFYVGCLILHFRYQIQYVRNSNRKAR